MASTSAALSVVKTCAAPSPIAPSLQGGPAVCTGGEARRCRGAAFAGREPRREIAAAATQSTERRVLRAPRFPSDLIDKRGDIICQNDRLAALQLHVGDA